MSDASPGTWNGLTYTCACAGCWACSGNVSDCTCDVDWEEVYAPREDGAATPIAASHLLGIDPNFTGDLSTAEYMDEQRGRT